MSLSQEQPIRRLILARRPLRLDDIATPGDGDRITDLLIRKPKNIEDAIEEFDPNVLLVDTGFPDRGGYAAIERALRDSPGLRVLALTPDPPPHEHVALAMDAGAVGFIDINVEPEEFTAATNNVAAGGDWLPADQTRDVLRAAAADLSVTEDQRRSRMTSVILGLIPVTGAIAAIMAIFLRSYLGQIGVRTVDLAVDPASRVIDALFAMLSIAGFFGPLLFVGRAVDLLRNSKANRGALSWFLRWRTGAVLVISLLWLAVATVLTVGPDLALVLFVGPVVCLALIANSIGISDDLPTLLRIDNISPTRILIGVSTALFIFIAALGFEAMVVGPSFSTTGVTGVMVPDVLGIEAQPVQAFNLDEGGPPREVLYLGGNADLYVLVDPCNDDEVDYVPVGAHRLVVIDKVHCP